MRGVRRSGFAIRPFRGVCTLPALLVVGAVVACGGSDGGTAPGAVSFSGTYYGQIAWGAATCTPNQPPSSRFIVAAFTGVSLWEVQQAGDRVTLMDASDPGVQFAGTVAANGEASVEASFTFGDTEFDVSARQRYTLRLSSGDRLTGAGDVVSEARRALTNAFFATCTRAVSVDLTRHLTPVPTIQATACSQEQGLRSQRDDSRALLLVRNQSARAITLYWRNYEGNRVEGPSVGPGEVAATSTFVTHPFVVTDATSKQCLGIYLPVPGPSRAIIQ